MLQGNKRKSKVKQGGQRRHKQQSFEVFDVAKDGTLSIKNSEGSQSPQIVKQTDQKVVNVVEWSIDGDRISTSNSLATLTCADPSPIQDSSVGHGNVNEMPTSSAYLLANEPIDYTNLVYEFGDSIQDQTPEIPALRKQTQGDNPIQVWMKEIDVFLDELMFKTTARI
ncbi:hypothetical protein M378DRAFT_14030 [Amanita muscaria Koide BX008]|uniref:Uncharacterized protein n=1 Tax=Amanita muscaria (strain Koide BX008) TaxID=946122 RepID=A0A0C2T275_AMAMK|nr:hypothetical protein M378DRAFT_14030 [Amanita muscaria Koide BX008]